MNHTLQRLVPTSGALAAAVALIDPTRTPDPVNRAFSEWYLRSRPGHIIGLTHTIALTVGEVESLLAEDIPRTPAGIAWTAEIRAAVHRTRSDVWRPYDRVDVAADPRFEDLDSLAERMEDLSPMTVCLADGIRSMTSPEQHTIGAYAAMADRIADDGFVIGGDGQWEESPRTVVTWNHVDALVPTFRAEITALVDGIVASLPATGEDDGGQFRHGLDPHGGS